MENQKEKNMNNHMGTGVMDWFTGSTVSPHSEYPSGQSLKIRIYIGLPLFMENTVHSVPYSSINNQTCGLLVVGILIPLHPKTKARS